MSKLKTQFASISGAYSARTRHGTCYFDCQLQHTQPPCVCLCVCTEDPLLRQDDIWMLDGDFPQEALPRAQRPDHLDFLRITPPEDDIMGDTPYCPKLERTVRVTQALPN